ncbi:MAG TPA: fluoride efflux transporter CrcB [Prevotella sp.]|nr:fluoride efflux transporter CrcB [Prevotella sp.]
MRNMLFVALGGAIGSVARYLVSKMVNESFSSSFPLATMLVNIAGCVLIGIFLSLSERFSLGEGSRLLLTVGLCGGFTTFSTFMNENLLLLRVGSIGQLALYAGGSVALGLLGVFAGRYLCSSII